MSSTELSTDVGDVFTAAVGGREKLITTLTIGGSVDTRVDVVLNRLLDPKFKTLSLHRICSDAQLAIADLFSAYKRALLIKAHVEAVQRIAEHLPAVVEDVMLRALPGTLPCPTCHGAVPAFGAKPCAQCHGAGTIPTEPPVARQKLALELGRMIEHKAGVLVQQNTHAAPAPAVTAGNLQALGQVVSELLFAPDRRRAASPPIDATATPQPEEAPDAPGT